MSDILIGVTVFGLVFGAAIFGMFLGRNLRDLEQKVNKSDPPLPRLRRAKQTERSDDLMPPSQVSSMKLRCPRCKKTSPKNSTKCLRKPARF